MEITQMQDGERIVFTLNGRLGATEAPGLQQELASAFDVSNEIALDFRELLYVSSAGLRVLLWAQKTLRAKKGTLKLMNVSENVMEVFEMTGFSSILNIE